MAIGLGSLAGFVYVIGPAEPVKPYRVKIGQSGNVIKRLRDLQVASPVRLEILHIIQDEEPLRLERELHGELAEFQCHGGWFDLGDDPVAVVKSTLEEIRAAASRGRPATPPSGGSVNGKDSNVQQVPH